MRFLPIAMFSFVLLFATTNIFRAEAADPRQPGPYVVGVRTEVFIDQDRLCAITEKPRTLVTEIWYPVAKDAKPTKANKFSDFWSGPGGLAMGALAIKQFGGDFAKLDESFKNVAMRDADAAEGSFPLLIFSHGNGGLRHQNTFQAEYLASHGYVVAAPDHTGNAAVTILPDQIVIYSAKTREPERVDDRPHDVSFLLTHLTELAAGKEHWLSGRIDAEKLAAFGHSFGGFTVCRTTELEPRIKAIIPMTLAISKRIFEDEEESEVKTEHTPCNVPMLVLLGDADRTVNEVGNLASTAYFEAATGPKYLLNFKDAGHFTFTEMTQINPDWGDGIGADKDDEGNVTFAYSDALEDQRITNEYSVAFFDCFLREDEAAKAFLEKNHYPEELEHRVE